MGRPMILIMLSGSWIITMVELTAIGLKEPNEPMKLFSHPIPIRNKFVPWIVLFYMSVGTLRIVAYDILIGMCLGLLQH
jgi:hypothetical protein